MRIQRKITSTLLAVCLVASAAAISSVSTASATTDSQLAQDTVEGGAILHCFNWSYNNIKANLASIKAAGYTAVQTSPVQQPKDYSSSYTDQSGQWWKLYQPLGLSVADGTTWLGTKAELQSLCEEAENYGIKVIVDIVANHMANNGSDGGGFSYVNTDIESDLYNSSYFHSTNTYTSDSNRYTITQYHLGMPDLNTSNSYVQQRVLGLLEECVDLGVDGFRFDAAKHIELPTDTSSSCASDFWPTVLNGIDAYTSNDLYNYGEILNSAGTDISNYTTYLDVTDNYTGDYALYSAYTQNCGALADCTYYKGAEADDSVLWVESHDTYMGSSGSAGLSNTASVSDDVIVRAWAIVGSRADSTSLFFARPASTMGSASTDTTWCSTAVAEVNKFKNYFEGTTEYLGYSTTYNTTYNERGTAGVVISKLDGGGYVSLTANKIADGTYTDQVSGNTFTVSNGVITGTVGSTGVAVVYNTGDSTSTDSKTSSTSSTSSTSDTLYLVPNSNWTTASARFAMYVFNSSTDSNAWASMTDSDGDGTYEGSVPDGTWDYVIFCRMNSSSTINSWSYVWNQTNDLALSDSYNCYTVASGAWSYGSGTWSSYTANPTEETTTATEETTSSSSSSSSSSSGSSSRPDGPGGNSSGGRGGRR